MADSEVIKTVLRDINWHEDNRGISGKSEDFEDGFLEGMRQVVVLLRKCEEIDVAEAGQ